MYTYIYIYIYVCRLGLGSGGLVDEQFINKRTKSLLKLRKLSITNNNDYY